MSDFDLKQLMHNEVALAYQEVLAYGHNLTQRSTVDEIYETPLFRTTAVREK